MIKTAAALSLLASTAFAAAQGQMDSFDFLVADMNILQSRKVQDEIGVSATQREKMNSFSKAHTERLKSYETSIKDLKPTDENKKKVQIQLTSYMKRLKTEVMGTLSKTQLKRLREVTLQLYGWSAVADERVAKKIGMTDSQVKKAQSILTEANGRIRTLEKSAADPVLAGYKDRKPKDEAQAQQWRKELDAKLGSARAKIEPQATAIQQKAYKDVQAVLNAKQKAAYTALQGKKFTAK